MEIKIKEIEVTKLNLKLDDVLIVKYTGAVTQHILQELKEGFQKYFPENKIAVLGLPEGDDLLLTVANHD